MNGAIERERESSMAPLYLRLRKEIINECMFRSYTLLAL